MSSLHAIDEVANLAYFYTVHLPVAKKKVVWLNELDQQGALENCGNPLLVSLSNNPYISGCCVDKDNVYLGVAVGMMWSYHAVDLATAVDAFHHVVVLPRSRRVRSGNLANLAARMYESNPGQMNWNLRKTVNCRVQSEHNSNNKYQTDLKKYCAYHHVGF
jgi:hypothetical protein